MQILILGMHRSGTSMTTRLINMMGSYFGPESSVGEMTADNPKGFWERPEVFKLNEALLGGHGCSWHNLRNWSVGNAEIVPDAIKNEIKKLILGMDAFRPWVLKDPRLCLLLPGWLPYLEVPVAVIVHRNPFEIAISLKRRNGFSIEYGVALWEHYAVGLLNATQHVPRIYVRFSDLHENPVKTCETLYSQLVAAGARRLAMPSEREIRAFVDPMLYRSKRDVKTEELSQAQKNLVEMLRGVRPQEGETQVSDASKTIIRNYQESRP